MKFIGNVIWIICGGLLSAIGWWLAAANGGIANLVNPDAKDKDAVALFQYIADEGMLEKLFESQQIIRTPVVRNGRQSTVGYQPDIWKKWE